MRELHGNLHKVCAFSFLHRTLFPMAVISLFWKDHIGLSLTQILILQGVFSAVSVLFEYPSGYVSDRLGYRAALNLASLLGVIGWGLYTVADSFMHVLLAEATLAVSLSFISGTDSALLYETLRAKGKESSYPQFEGRMNGFAQAGETFGALFAGALYAAAPLLPFFLQVGVWIAALLLTRTLMEVPKEAPEPSRSPVSEALWVARYALAENRRLRSMILYATILCLASFYPVWMIQPYMRQAGIPLGWFGPIWAGANLTIVLSALGSGRIARILGDTRICILFAALVLAGYGGLGLSGGFWGFLFYYMLTCMRGLGRPLLLGHAQAECPSAHRAAILSLFSLSFRLSFACTGPLVGRVADTIGLRQTFYALFFVFLVVLPPLTFFFIRALSARKPAFAESRRGLSVTMKASADNPVK
jgi:MFS family permease